MPQKWSLSSSVMCIIRKTRTNRILVKQCNVFIVNCDAQYNQKLRILVIVYQDRKKGMNVSEWKTVKVITSLHTLIVFHLESEFQSNCVPRQSVKQSISVINSFTVF